MKSVKLLITVMFAVVLVLTTSAQTQSGKQNASTKTETFKVWGKCDMCKNRIEKTAKVEGVTNADWNIKTSMLSVTFDSAKTNVDALSKKLALVGHDTEKYKADDKVYNALPGCCHYERTK
jgi:periplasmic mercuric ion binding protein